MKLTLLTAGIDDFFATQIDDSCPPDEMEYQIVNTAKEMFPHHKQMFYYESGYPTVDLMMNSRIEHRLIFDK